MKLKQPIDPIEEDAPISLSTAIEIIFNVEQGRDIETIEGILSTYIL